MKPLQVDLRPSPRLAAILMAACSSALLLLLIVPVVWWMKLVGGVGIVVASVWHLRRQAWRSVPEAWVGLRWSAEHGWQAWRRNDEALQIVILPDSTVTSALSVIRFRCEGQRWPQVVVLLADSAESEALRRLRVQLRWAYERTPVEPAPR